MPIVYNPKDVFVVQRNATSSSFEEKVLSSAPNSLFFFDSASNVVALLSSSVTAGTAITAISASYASTASVALNVPLTASYASTASFAFDTPASVSSSHAVIADTASLVEFVGVVDNYVPTWQNRKLTATSPINVDPTGQYVIINSASLSTLPSPPALAVRNADPTSFYVAHFEADLDNYAVVSLQNKASSSFSTAEFVAAGDVGYANNNFIGVGMNSSTYNDPTWNITSGSDGYVYVSEGDMAIGTVSPTRVTKLFAGGSTADKEVARITEAGMTLTGSIQLSLNGVISANTNSAQPAFKQGTIWWDDNAKTFAIYTDHSGVSLQIGQESWLRGYAHEYIPNGTPVYVDDAIGGLPCVSLAQADGNGVKYAVIGIATENISSGSIGVITTLGQIHDVDTSMFAVGAGLFLSHLQSGSIISYPPPDPYEKVVLGYVLVSDSTAGIIQVNVVGLPQTSYPFVGITRVPSITNLGGGSFMIGTGSVNLCTSTDGSGLVKNYQLNSASFTVSTSSFLDAQHIVAKYNSGIPIFDIVTDKSTVDDIQTTLVYTLTVGAGGSISQVGYDNPGNLLADKLLERITTTNGIERKSGLALSTSGSRYCTITSGSIWNGINLVVLPAVNSSVNRFVLAAHSASIWSGSFITQLTNTQCDDGTNVVDLGGGSGHWVVNYIYRGVGSLNTSVVMYSNDYSSLTDAQSGQPPTPPTELTDISILVGRVIYKKSIDIPEQVDSAFVTSFTPSGITVHNDLNDIQGGTTNEYYHLTTTEYGNNTRGSFVRATGSAMIGTLYQASGSNGVPPAYIEPYDYSLDNVYRPPSKEGRTFWDHKWVNWKVWQDTNYSSSTAAALNINLSRETCIPVHNPSNVTLTRCTPVYISGSQTSSIYPFNQTWPTTYKPDVYAAEADGTNTMSDVVGLVRNNIPPHHDGYVITNGIMHNSNVSALGTIGTKLWVAPPGQALAHGLTNIKPDQPYEAVSVGWVSEIGDGGGTQGSVIVAISTEPPPLNAYAGVTSDIVITSDGSGAVYVSTGSVNLFDDATGFGLAYGHSLAAQTMSLISGSTNYIIAEHSGSTEIAHYYLTTDYTYANGINIVRVAQLDIYNADTSSWDVHQFNVGIVGLALANKHNNKDISLHGFERQNGLTLYTTGSTGEFGITSGVIWYGPNSHVVDTFDTTLPGYYTYIFHTTSSNGTASWHQHTSSIYLAGLYNSSSGTGLGNFGLDVCAPNSWSVNFVYRIIGTSDEAAIVLSNNQYVDESTARSNATQPSNLPSTITDQSMLVGRFIVQSGSYATTVIESAFSTIFAAAAVTDHESLTGLQGGQGGEHYHMTQADYVGTGTGVMARQSSPILVTPIFTGATTGHIPYWKNDQTLTLTGSVQVYNDQYVLINSGSADPVNPEALLVYQKNTSSANTIGAYSNVNSFSQIYNQNINSGSEASTDICATADIGTQDANFIDMGIAGSGFASVFWPFEKPLDGYIYVHGGDFWVGTLTDNKLLFVFNNTASNNYADKTGFYLSGSFFGTSSWASKAVSASYSPVEPNYSASVSTYFNTKQNNLVTGNTYTITSSWAEKATTASYAPVEPGYSSSAASYIDTKQPTLVTGNTYTITSSWSVSSSWAPYIDTGTTLYTGSTYQITSSRAVTASYSPVEPDYSASVSNFFGTKQNNLVTGNTYTITSSWASNSISASSVVTASFALGVPTIKSGIVAGTLFAGNPKTASIVFTNPFADNNYSVTVTGEPSRTWTIQNKVSGSFQINANNNTAFATNVFWQAIQTGEFYS